MNFTCFLLIVFSGFYLIDAPISPVYITFIISIFGVVVGRYIPKPKEIFQKSIIITLIVTMFIQMISHMGFSHSAINVVFSLLYGLVTFWVCSRTDKEVILKCCDKLVTFSIIFLIIEAMWRFMHPEYSQALIEGGIGYYQYKSSSIIFEDSNFVGLYSMTMFFLTIFIEKTTGKNYRKSRLLLFVLTLGTFSKGAIATIVLYSIIFSNKLKKWQKYFILSTGGVFAIYKFYQQIMFDGSLWERNYVITKSLEYFGNSDIVHKLFGYGFGSVANLPFKGGHNIFAVLLVEIGIIGTLFIVGSLLVIGKKYRDTFLLIFPFLIATNATYAHANSYLYCLIAVLVSLNLKDNRAYSNKYIIIRD